MSVNSHPDNKSRKIRKILIIVGIVIVLAVLWVWLAPKFKKTDANKAPAPIPVEVATAKRADVPVYVEGLGTVQAFHTVTVTARVDGRLDSVAFTEGQQVAKGSLLAQIDPRTFQAALDQAKATLDKDTATLGNARRDLERYEALVPDQLASKQQVDTQRALVVQLEAQTKGDRAAIDTARTQLDYTTITSPIAGRTGIRQVDAGNNVHASDPNGIVVVTQLQPISIIFSLPEDKFGEVSDALRRGPVQAIAVSRDRHDQLDKGTLSLIDNQIDATTGTMKLKAVFPNAQGKLWPGEFVNVQVLTQVLKQALTIPLSALQRGPDGMFTYTLKPGAPKPESNARTDASGKSDAPDKPEAAARPDANAKDAPAAAGEPVYTVEATKLEVGVQAGDIAVINKGLEENQKVVTTNQYRLQPGAVARIRKNPGPNPPPDAGSKPENKSDARPAQNAGEQPADKANK